ncbi:MAG: hypothetical protein ABJH63_20145 [Rhizobiaceae bacterium]
MITQSIKAVFRTAGLDNLVLGKNPLRLPITGNRNWGSSNGLVRSTQIKTMAQGHNFRIITILAIIGLCLFPGTRGLSQTSDFEKIIQLTQQLEQKSKEIAQKKKVLAEAKKNANEQDGVVRILLANIGPIRDEAESFKRRIKTIDDYFEKINFPEKVKREIEEDAPWIRAAIHRFENGSSAEDRELGKQLLAYVVQRKIRADALAKNPPAPPVKDPKKRRLQLQQKLNQVQARLNPLESIFTEESRKNQKAMAKHSAHSAAVSLATQQYYKLLFDLDQNYKLPKVTQVAVHTAGQESPAYLAIRKVGKEQKLLEKQISILIAAHPIFVDAKSAFNLLFANAETRFKDVAKEWDEKHQEATSLMERAYYLNTALELADAAIGIGLDGATPFSVLFEAGYRTVEAFSSDFSIPEPKVSEGLLDLKKRVADTVEKVGQPNQRPPKVKSDSFGLPVSVHASLSGAEKEALNVKTLSSLNDVKSLIVNDDQLGELEKGAWGNGLGLAAKIVSENLAQDTLENGNKSFTNLMTAFMLNPELEATQYWNKIARNSGPTREFSDISKVLKQAIPERGDGLLKQFLAADRKGKFLFDLGNKGGWKAIQSVPEIGKGVLVGAVVTAAKEPIRDWAARDPRAKVAAELALLDIKWMIRRGEYRAAGQAYRAAKRHLLEFRSAIGKLIEERDQTTIRELRNDNPLSLTNTVIVFVNFDRRPPKGTRISINGKFFPTTLVAKSAQIRVEPNDLKAGKAKLGMDMGLRILNPPLNDQFSIVEPVTVEFGDLRAKQIIMLSPRGESPLLEDTK